MLLAISADGRRKAAALLGEQHEGSSYNIRGSFVESSHGKMEAALNLLINSNKFVRQSRHIGAQTKTVFVVRVTFLLIYRKDLLVF